MKKITLATLVPLILIGCGGGSSSDKNTPAQPDIDTCQQVKLDDGTILDLAVVENPDGSLEYGYYDNDQFVLHRNCNDEPAVKFKSEYSANSRKIWLQHGKHYREEDKPNAVIVEVEQGRIERYEQWRDGAWPPIEDLNYENAHLYKFKDRGDKPNYINSYAYENGNTKEIAHEAWLLDYGTEHRVGAPASISYYTETEHGLGAKGVNAQYWSDHGKLLKYKNFYRDGSSPYNSECVWYINNDQWDSRVTEYGYDDSYICENEATNDTNYLVWDGDQVIDNPPIDESVYQFLEQQGIDREEAVAICTSTKTLKVRCEEAYNEDSYQIWMSPNRTVTTTFDGTVQVTNEYSSFDYSLNTSYQDSISFEIENSWLVLEPHDSLEYAYNDYDNDDYVIKTTTHLLDASGNFIDTIETNMQMLDGYSEEESELRERNYLWVEEDNFAELFLSFDGASDVRIENAAHPIIDGNAHEMPEYVLTEGYGKFFVEAMQRAKLIHRYKNN